MDLQLAVICGLTFAIQLIGALAYSARIAGVRTGRTRRFPCRRQTAESILCERLAVRIEVPVAYRGTAVAIRGSRGAARRRAIQRNCGRAANRTV